MLPASQRMDIMKFSDMDQAPSGNKPLANCLRWLRTCLAVCPTWTPEQRTAAKQATEEAEALLATELHPDMQTSDWVALTATFLDSEEGPLVKMLRDWREEGKAPTCQELLAAHLYESSLQDRLRAMAKALSEVGVRIAFIGWPAETHWRDGDGDRQRWVPDWGKEIGLITAARHGRLPHARQLQEPRETLPWNRIPEEYRPGHMNEARLRLHKLHLAYLDYKEDDGSGSFASKAAGRLLKALGAVFDKQPLPGASPDLAVHEKAQV